ncbi:DNA-processing protein DprA [Aerococcus mictus]|uniref:DNA-processing protein DprA n=1 Tax=Aerococcus mictus TaxID=2976810 RepID=UPI00227AB5A7|nr:DNA-processing protein DprA [Aerococcus mictus]MCY3076733.1 DNA-processing protein DprA [Aerococcus mictus]
MYDERNYHGARQVLIHLTESAIVGYEDRVQVFKGLLENPDYQEVLRHYLKGRKYYPKLLRFLSHRPWSFYQNYYEKEKIFPITYFDPQYPDLLKESHKPPLVLFCQGNIDWLKADCLSIVGARDCSNYTQKVIDKLMPNLVNSLVIVSGLARGVDSLAHRSSIQNSGRTIAVIGTGLAKVYPKEHRALQDFIAKNHLLVSPLPSFTGVKKWHFPYRNEVIAGLSRATWVVEAKKKSGSLITANYALQANREVLATPGNIFSVRSQGTNALIQAGAKLISEADDILETYRYPFFI